jgi:hypothetical protein
MWEEGVARISHNSIELSTISLCQNPTMDPDHFLTGYTLRDSSQPDSLLRPSRPWVSPRDLRTSHVSKASLDRSIIRMSFILKRFNSGSPFCSCLIENPTFCPARFKQQERIHRVFSSGDNGTNLAVMCCQQSDFCSIRAAPQPIVV